MKLVKREHACLVLNRSNEHLVIDPGSFTLPLSDLRDVAAIVITHEHPDHWTPEHLDRILDLNPEAKIFGPSGVALAAKSHQITVVKHGDVITVGAFTLQFFGEKHAVIHESIPVIDNVGVLVNDVLWYGGDSYTVPPVEVDVAAIPVGAPWLKIGEAMDYTTSLKPKRSFGTHDMTLSVIGKQMASARITTMTEAAGGQYFALEPGDELEL